MSDFAELVARAVTPGMDRAAREAVYAVVREAVQRLQEREATSAGDQRFAYQQHLIEETIRDVEADVARFEALRKLDEALAAQTAAHSSTARRR
ncbi:hypothetical protein [Methylobacterium sp. sgz302541]|uniref:hypothetical protein n=1 Tax=unclassified Methylobacterium TaxID=2615210 RepID=UPI003D33C7B3